MDGVQKGRRVQRVQGVQRVFRKFRKKDLKTFTAISVDRKQLPPWKLLQMTVLTFKTRNISCFFKNSQNSLEFLLCKHFNNVKETQSATLGVVNESI